MTIEKIKILEAVLELPAKQHCQFGQFGLIGLKVQVPYTTQRCGWSPQRLGNSANTNSIRQAKGGSLTVDPIPTPHCYFRIF